jgi:hypothetical protein
MMMNCSKEIIRFEANLSKSDILKGPPGSKSNEKENASNTNAIKSRIYMDLNHEQ